MFHALRGCTMAKLPSTIYATLEKNQRMLYQSGGPAGLPIEDVYAVFDECGYRRSTANKWLLNWAVCRRVKFLNGAAGYELQFGFFDGKPSEMLLNGKVWLPVKEVKFKTCEARIR